ncbi:MAG TPA: SMP-30/gluconolactonase/LRE family protein [Armatimonadota bacterium]|nr:SMP-30/gluconolactonase/LRE family protein [Armatimonadota bacterium]
MPATSHHDDTFTLFADSRCDIAENPLWNVHEQMLYWKGDADAVYRQAFGGSVETFETFHLGIRVGGMAFTRDNAVLIFAEHGRVYRWQPGTKPVCVAELPGATATTYFNDVIVDPQGRVFCGVLANDFFHPSRRGTAGSLWRFDTDGSFHCLEPATGAIPNGMGFSRDGRHFYFAVTDTGVIYRYDYDRATGNLANPMPWISRGGPDGLTVDADGCVWVAHWDSPLTRYAPDGNVLREYHLPVRTVSSVTFGGSDNTTIFVTTAKSSAAPSPHDGGVFALTQSIHGVPEFLAAEHHQR